MATIDEIRKNRVKKLEAIKKAGFFAYPLSSNRTHTVSQALKDFSSLSRAKKEIVLVGRIRSQREHGKACFFNIEDGSGSPPHPHTKNLVVGAHQKFGVGAKIQAFLRENRVGEKNYKFFLENFDIGDFIEVRGVLFKTKTNEKTIEIADYKILAKSLLPLPEKWHGLQDIEERYRKRYLDLIFNEDVKKKFELRFLIIRELRNFLDSEGFLEVETPILQPVYGGANAKPFKTRLNALALDLYLRIAPELYLKRLLVGGFEKVYEIGKCFRNEGVDKHHNPDFTMLEFYQAYVDYKDLMKFTEKMFGAILKKIFGRLEIEYSPPHPHTKNLVVGAHQNSGVGARAKKINFKTPWQRIEFNQLLKKYASIDLDEINQQKLTQQAQKLEIKIEKGEGKTEIADKIYKKVCQEKLWQPTFIIHHPLGTAPLAKQLEREPSKLGRFQLVAAGIELVNAFSELNDPIEQKKRFEEQEKAFGAGLEESQRMDEDFIEALEYGMPPAAGWGMGIDRLVALLTDSHSLREIILFPTMRSKEK